MNVNSYLIQLSDERNITPSDALRFETNLETWYCKMLIKALLGLKIVVTCCQIANIYFLSHMHSVVRRQSNKTGLA
jgi:hypothetical protein